MTSKKTTRRALFSSVIALILCCSMLVGTTFAWFTDEVKSMNNVITAGNLDVDVVTADGNTIHEQATLFDEITLWEPGVVAYETLTVKNIGTLALKYQMDLNFTNATATPAGKTLVDVLKVGVINAAVADNATRAEVLAQVTTWQPLETFSLTGELAANTDATPVTLVIYWEPNVLEDNDYNMNNGQTAVLSIDLGVNLYATQLEAELDSFGPDYDAGAWVEPMFVATEAELITALTVNDPNVAIVLSDDIVLSGTWTPVGDKDAGEYFMGTLDGNGHTISGLNVAANDYDALISAAKDATIKNLTVEGVVNGVNAAGIVARVEGTTVIENCVSNVAVTGTTKAGGIVSNVTGADAKIVNCTNNGVVSCSNAKAGGVGGLVGYVNTNAHLEIIDSTNNGAVTGTDGQTTGAVIGYAAANSSGMIAGFVNTGVITGKNYVGDGNGRWIEAEDGTVLAGYCGTPANWVAAETVSSPEELAETLAAAAAAGAGDSTIVLTGDIDMTGTTWTPISVDGYHGAGVVTVEGNGNTITGLNAPLFAGGFAGKSGIVIKNLTIADSNIVSTSGLGGGAFVDTADSMHVITLENCHLVNSTVSGERAGGLIGWCSGYAKLDDGPVKAYVTISNCSVVDSTVVGAGSAGAIAGHPGASDYTYTTIEDCEVKNVDVVSNDDGDWRTGAIVGTANNGHIVINNVTVEDVTLTQNGVTAENVVLYGRFVPSGTGTLVIDGAAVLPAATDAALKDALAAGETDVYVGAGEYNLPSVSNGDVTISGTEDTVITIGKPNYSGSDITFNGVTIQGSGYATGVQHVDTVTYNDVTIKGVMCLYGEKVVFNDCTFDLTEVVDYIWTYGAKEVEFNNCTFNTNGKAVLIYNEGADLVTKVTVKGCTFNATASALASGATAAAIEIDSSLATNGHYTLVTEGNTVDSDFSGEWRIKKSGTDNTTVNGVVYNAITIDGVVQQ